MLPLINARRIDLLDNRKLQAQLIGLERRVSRAGKDSIDHAPRQHDDVCNVVAGLARLLMVPASTLDYGIMMGDNKVTDPGQPTPWPAGTYFYRMMNGGAYPSLTKARHATTPRYPRSINREPPAP